jgi:hypothetical protein
MKFENWSLPSLPCFVDCVNTYGNQNSQEKSIVVGWAIVFNGD